MTYMTDVPAINSVLHELDKQLGTDLNILH